MKLGLAPLTLFRPPQLELVRCAGEAGYDAVGFQLGLQQVPISPLVDDPQFLREAKVELERWNLEVMEVSNIVFEPDRTIDEAKRLIDFAVNIGASIVQATIWDIERSRVVDRLGAVAEYAESVQLSITVEYMPYSACRSFDDACSLIQVTAKDNVNVLLDVLHFARSGGVIGDLESPRASSYAFVQLCDARKEPPAFADLRQEAISDRLPLGEGGLALGQIMERIATDLPISLEIPCQRLKELPLVVQATEHLRIARKVLAPFEQRWADQR